MSPCAEIVTFRLTTSTSTQAFLKAAEATIPVIQEFDGCLMRNLSVDDDGLWTDMVVWKDQETALKAADTVPKDLRFAPFASMIDGSSVVMRHAQVEMTM